jgi:hypothetical protein
MVKKPTVTDTMKLNRLHRFGHVPRMEENGIPKGVLYQDEVREDGRLVDGEVWKGRVYNREEWKKLLRMARNCHILRMSME